MLPEYKETGVAPQCPVVCCGSGDMTYIHRGLEGSLKSPIARPLCDPQLKNTLNTNDMTETIHRRKAFHCCSKDEMGEKPIITLHKVAQKKEDYSGKYYPEEMDLARVCNPVGGPSYLTASPLRCNRVYRCCEPIGVTYMGHIPNDQFLSGCNRSRTSRNALKYLTYRP